MCTIPCSLYYILFYSKKIINASFVCLYNVTYMDPEPSAATASSRSCWLLSRFAGHCIILDIFTRALWTFTETSSGPTSAASNTNITLVMAMTPHSCFRKLPGAAGGISGSAISFLLPGSIQDLNLKYK